ncbi:carbohydrate porin [Chelatococcus reniformis]
MDRSRRPNRSTIALACWACCGSAPAWALEASEARRAAEARRIAAEAPAIGSPFGAGGDPQTSVAQPDTSAKPSANVTTSIADGLGPLGDPGGYRAFLKRHGVDYSLTYIGEVLGNASGGRRRGGVYAGRLDAQIDLDIEKLVGWKGGAAHATFYQIQGADISHSYIGNGMTASGIEALPSSRLFELWFEQRLFDDRLSLRAGQLAADTEFAVSQTATLFVNSTFGWPAILAMDLPSGGPIYPLATPGARVKYVPNENLSFQVGVFNGDPAGPDRLGLQPEPQRRNRRGTNFRVTDPAFVIGEIAYAYNIDAGSKGQPGTITVGGWHHFGRFDSLRHEVGGLALSGATAEGAARRLRGNSGVYGMIDQTIYREPNDPNDGASAFVRVAASLGDRNPVDFYVDAGLAYKGLLPGRSDDTLGVAIAHARFSGGARGADRDAILLGDDGGGFVRKAETVLEATYQVVLGPGISVQPDFQYIIRPGGGLRNPRYPAAGRLADAAIVGLRWTIRY